MKKLVAMVGTNSKKSTNRDLLNFISKHFADQADIELMEIDGLPLFNKPADKEVPQQAKDMAAKIEAADGVIISTPEYDHTVPAPLVNALNWLSYHIYPFTDKPVMITGSSYGRLGSSRAQMHLRQILDSPDIKARVLPNSEFMLGYGLDAFDSKGDLKDADTTKQLEAIFEDFMTFIDITEQLIEARGSKLQEAKDFDWEK
ncbi:NADPH-dependent FMN reductase [Suicoccus acidiformans]|uniref:NADPH-dependent FMN reductase n=1 Tax=Suicoccus acidiformans TaxID=2036206 RepID=A0A347WKQ3_9LACT|nr:NADPH-dependent FMN reductase [Suicoccus acidiformans]AXY25660.1 NADPH-dependent FMN reductase [Suicoccus acidiformans]